MPVTRKTPTQLVAEVTALLDLDAAKVNVEHLRDLLISGFSNIKGPIYYIEKSDFITGTDIKSIVSTDLDGGDLICVIINNVIHHYVVVEGALDADISPYLIKPDDYNADTNAKYFRKANCSYHTFDNDDISEAIVTLTHNAGVRYCDVIIFNSFGERVPYVLDADLSAEKNVFVTCKDEDTVTAKFASTITGTYKALIVF